MVRFSPLRLAKPLRRRQLLTLASLVCYVAVAGGFPLPQWAPIKSSAERFPCQDHACGCSTAAQCWHDCCCLSLAERVAWAEAHDVTIPADIRTQLVQWRQPAKRACCANRENHAQSGTQQAVDAGPSGRSTKVLLPQLVRQCRGLATSWVCCGAVTLPPATADCSSEMPFIEWLVVVESSFDSPSERPDVPPPRV